MSWIDKLLAVFLKVEEQPQTASFESRPNYNPEPEEESPPPSREISPPTKSSLSPGSQTPKRKRNREKPLGLHYFPPLNCLRMPQGCRPTDIARSELDPFIREFLHLLDENGVEHEEISVDVGPTFTGIQFRLPEPLADYLVADIERTLQKNRPGLIVFNLESKCLLVARVPHTDPYDVTIREILESPEWSNSQHLLPLALGLDKTNSPFVIDLVRARNLLISGPPESGKTNVIHAIFAGLLFHSTPDDLRLLVVDTKLLEYSVFERGLGFLLAPIITDASRMPGILDYFLAEIERRFRLFSTANVRDIKGYNDKMDRNRVELEAVRRSADELSGSLSPEELEKAEDSIMFHEDNSSGCELPERVPYLVCVIDEVSDLHGWAQINDAFLRLLSMAPRAGIHFICSCESSFTSQMSPSFREHFRTRINLTHLPDVFSSGPSISPVGAFEVPPRISMGNAPESSDPGYVYIMTNSTILEGVIKIGLTRNSPDDRAAQLSSATGVAENFEVIYSCETANCRALESAVHSELDSCRVSRNREFFRCSPEAAIEVIERIRHRLESKNLGVGPSIAGRTPHVLPIEIDRLMEHQAAHNDPLDFHRFHPEDIDEGWDYDHKEWEDDLVPEAMEIIRQTGRVSGGMLMRRLQIGYCRLGHLLNALEAEGFIGPERPGNEPREIIGN
jgi:hypothetical protein